VKNPLSLAAALACSLASSIVAADPPPASAAPVVGVDLPLPFDQEPFPADRSKAPTPDEWREAKLVTATTQIDACRIYRVREWIKIRCSGFPASGLAMIAGPTEGVGVFMDPAKLTADGNMDRFSPRSATIQFPALRGEGHLFQILEFGDSYEGVGAPVLKAIVSEYWADGEPAPKLVIR
jgi:hypothetical protein